MARKKRFDRLISFHITSKLLKRLDEFVEERGWTRNFAIREAIRKLIKK